MKPREETGPVRLGNCTRDSCPQWRSCEHDRRVNACRDASEADAMDAAMDREAMEDD